ncbi:hypothetical protein BAE44_0016974, partial [Dichanthelium oligosanthes]
LLSYCGPYGCTWIPWAMCGSETTDARRLVGRVTPAEAFKNDVPKVETLERALREGSKGKAFFGSDAVGLVDIALGSHLVWIRVVDEVAGTNLLDGPKFPGLAAWAERFLAVDAVKKVMPDAGKVLEQYKGFQAKWIAAAGSMWGSDRSLLDMLTRGGGWAQWFLEVDAVKEAVPDTGKLLERYKGYLAKWTESAAVPAGSTG